MGETVQTFTKNNKNWLIALTCIALAVGGGRIIYGIQQSKSSVSEVEMTVVEKAEITAVTALGRIEPDGEIINLAPSPNLGGAKVETLLVKEGDKVKKGDIIAILDNNELKKAEINRVKEEIKVAQAKVAVIQAGAKQGQINAQRATIERLEAQLRGEIAKDNAKIARLKAQLVSERKEKRATIQRFKAELENARVEFRRNQSLASEGAISQSALDQKRLVLDTAQERYDEAQASYQKTVSTINQEIAEANAIALQNVNTLQKQIDEAKARLDEIAEVRDVDVYQAQAEVNMAIASLQQLQKELETTTYIKTFSDGQVIEIKAYPGESIDLAEGIVELANTDQMLVIAEVHESDIGKVKLNQEAIIESENGSFTGQIRGKVIYLNKKINKKDVLDTDPAADVDSRVVEVKIAVDSEDNPKIAQLINSQVIVKILL